MPTQRPAPTAHRIPVRPHARIGASTSHGPRPTARSAAAAAERARQGLARELHDELGSVLTAARLDVAWLRTHGEASSVDLSGRLQRLEHLLLDGQSQLRRVVEGLHPSALAQFGLPVAVESLARGLACRFEGQMSISVSAQAQLEGPAALALYRCAQECLTNVGRHARASQATLRLERHGDRIRLRISDNGQGFSPDRVGSGHQGLLGMRARLREVGGQLRIETRPGGGTRITASVPAPTSH